MMKEKDFLDTLFDKARNEKSQVSLKQTIQSFEKVAVSSPSNFTKLFTIKNTVIMTLSTIVISSIIYFSIPSEKTLETKPIATKKVEIIPTETTTEIIIEKDSFYSESKRGYESIEKLSLRPINLELKTKEKEPEILHIRWKRPQKLGENEIKRDKRYPVLTEEEIKQNHKQKKKMLKNFTKLNSKYISSVVDSPKNQKVGEGNSVTFTVYNIQKNEVTNLEYRTFLFDLLIQNRRNEFDLAKPDQEEWVNYFEGEDLMKPMQKYYFSHSAYNEYPVVNITHKGAELYCKWINEEAKKVLGKELNPIRIPTKEEWTFTASANGKHKIFPWEGEHIKNDKGILLANFNVNGLTFLRNSDNSNLTARTGSYFENDFGLFNMAGNVSELVIDSKTGKYLTMGGSWMDAQEKLKIHQSEQPFEGNKGNPTVGFRVLMTKTIKRVISK